MMEDTFVHFESGMTPIERDFASLKERKRAYIKRCGRKAWNNLQEIKELARKLEYNNKAK